MTNKLAKRHKFREVMVDSFEIDSIQLLERLLGLHHFDTQHHSRFDSVLVETAPSGAGRILYQVMF